MHFIALYMPVKRILDIMGAILSFLVLWPILIYLCIAVKIDSPGPAIFVQWRVGRGHKLFKMYKFRTMLIDAEHNYNYLLNEKEIFCQSSDDPRVTKLGRKLRRLSLDELPQIFNILKGDMSFVGPRPLILREHNMIPALALKRLDVRPGLAGYAQAEGRSASPVIERFARDLYYVSNISFLLDIRIAIGTLKAVIKRKDAY